MQDYFFVIFKYANQNLTPFEIKKSKMIRMMLTKYIKEYVHYKNLPSHPIMFASGITKKGQVIFSDPSTSIIQC